MEHIDPVLTGLLSTWKVSGIGGSPKVEASCHSLSKSCPLCHATALQVMPDHVHGGEWMYCRHCQFGGDVIEFVARIWKLSVEATVDSMVDQGILTSFADEESLHNYVVNHAGHRQRLNRFWDEAQKRLTQESTTEIRQLLGRLGILDASTHSHWLTTGGRFFGTSNFSTITKLYAGAKHTRLSVSRRGVSSRLIRAQLETLFPEGCEEFLITPLYDLPGRICGFLAVGRQGHLNSGDYLYLPAKLTLETCTQEDLGVGLLPALELSAPKFQDVAVVVGDPEVALLLQGMHCRDSCRPLPLVFLAEGKVPRDPLPPPLTTRRLIFWGPPSQTLMLAKRFDGYISDLKIRKGTTCDVERYYTPVNCIQQVIEHAVPWAAIAERKAIGASITIDDEDGSKTPLIGFGEERDGFRFPQFTILKTGEIKFTQSLLEMTGNSRPGALLQPPDRDCSTALTLLSDNRTETRALWAMAACILHNLISHAAARSPFGVILDGDFAQTSGSAAAKMLGCLEVDLSHRPRNIPVLEAIRNAVSEQTWPSLIRFNDRSRRIITSQWIAEPALQNAILPLDSYSALAMSLHTGFVRLYAPERPASLEALAKLSARVIPDFLQDLCRRNQQIDSGQESPLHDVLHDLAGWFGRLGGDPTSVMAAQQLLLLDCGDLARTFLRLALRMVDQGDLTIAPAGRCWADIVHDAHAGTVRVHVRRLNDTLRRRRCPEVQLSLIEQNLKSEDAWIGSSWDVHGQYWLIKADWWNETVRVLSGNAGIEASEATNSESNSLSQSVQRDSDGPSGERLSSQGVMFTRARNGA